LNAFLTTHPSRIQATWNVYETRLILVNTFRNNFSNQNPLT
jgi:hypothetical protein